MLILLTNDDGIHSHGLTALTRRLADLADRVVAVAAAEEVDVVAAFRVGVDTRVIFRHRPQLVVAGAAFWLSVGLSRRRLLG